MTRARVWHAGRPLAGIVRGDRIELETGNSIAAHDAHYLAPVVARQIIGTHLTYRSRCEEYRMQALPKCPSYFMKPLGAVSHH